MLHGKGKTYDRQGEEKTKTKVDKCGIKSPANYPDQVEQQGKTPGPRGAADDLSSKGPEDQAGNLETLQPKWNTDDGAAKK